MTAKTIEIYENAWKFFGQSLEPLELDLTIRDKDERKVEEKKIADAIRCQIMSRKRGVPGYPVPAPGTINCYLRAMNAFLKWAYQEDGSLLYLWVVERQRGPSKVPQTLTGDEESKLICFKPTTLQQIRAHSLALFILDTGARIKEALHLQKADIDFTRMLVLLDGKGRKQRRVPVSPEGRVLLMKYISKHSDPDSPYVFTTGSGQPLSQRNALRDLQVVLKKAKIVYRPKQVVKTLRPGCISNVRTVDATVLPPGRKWAGTRFVIILDRPASMMLQAVLSCLELLKCLPQGIVLLPLSDSGPYRRYQEFGIDRVHEIAISPTVISSRLKMLLYGHG